MSTKLPASFTSVYRLVLRATSATVLHHTAATRSLRRQYRPVFDLAASVICKLNAEEQVSEEERNRLQLWLNEFDQRLDNTMSLLCNSALSRGLPHEVISRLASLPSYNYFSLQPKKLQWNPQLPPNSMEYQPKRVRPPKPGGAAAQRELREEEVERVKRGALDAVGCVLRMAEGREGLVLGRAGTTKNPRRAV